MPSTKKKSAGGASSRSRDFVPGVLLFLFAGAYYFLSNQRIVSAGLVHAEVHQSVGLLYTADVCFNLASAALERRASSKRRRSAAPLAGWPRTVLYCLPLFDVAGNVLTFVAIRMAGTGFQQTVGGANVPIGCVLNMLILGTRYSAGQVAGISVVVAGLSVKARALFGGDEEVSVVPFTMVILATVCYGEEGCFIPRVFAR